jgi:hypothetical protein
MGTPTAVVLIVCFASIAVADDFKRINGKEYKNATVTRVEPDGIVLKTKSGLSKLYFVELPHDVRERFGNRDPAEDVWKNASTVLSVRVSDLLDE